MIHLKRYGFGWDTLRPRPLSWAIDPFHGDSYFLLYNHSIVGRLLKDRNHWRWMFECCHLGGPACWGEAKKDATRESAMEAMCQHFWWAIGLPVPGGLPNPDAPRPLPAYFIHATDYVMSDGSSDPATPKKAWKDWTSDRRYRDNWKNTDFYRKL